MADSTIITVLSALVFLSVSIFTWACVPDATRQLMRRRILSEVAKKSRPPLIAVIGRWLEPINKRLPLKAYSVWANRLLESAGWKLPILHWLALQEIGAVTGAAVYFVLEGFKRPNATGLMVAALAGSVVPVLWLRNQIKLRRLTVVRDLPEIVDLLTLSVNAGSDFMTALSRIVREFRPCAVREELGIVLQEVRVGKRRRDALKAFALRLQTPETSTFSRTLIQVDRMGTGMAEALTVLSEDMRLQRYHWAERFAQQAPVKMLLPLILSLGAAMMIVAGPILLKFFRGDLMSAPKMTAAQHEANPGAH